MGLLILPSDYNPDAPLVVVFGGAGYIGSCLSRQLLNEGFRVRVFDNFLYGDDGVQNLESPNFEVIEEDICNTRAVSTATIGADAVILLAAIVGHRSRENQWNTTRDINFLASTVVLDAAIEHGIERFVFASTESVYGVQKGLMYETGTPEPVSLYSRLKLRMEERVMSEKTRFFHPTSLRISNCYGLAPRMRFDLIANGLVRDAVSRGKIAIDSGEDSRSFLDVEDAARACILCLKAHENLVSGEIFNVGNAEQTYTFGHICNIVGELCPNIEAVIGDNEEEILTDYTLSCSKIEKILDFKPQNNLVMRLAEIRDALESGVFSDAYSLKYSNT